MRTNGTDATIRDRATVTSKVTVANCAGKASSKAATVKVPSKHADRGDLRVDLIAPDGSVQAQGRELR